MGEALVAYDVAGEARQDWCEGCHPRTVCCVSNRRGGHPVAVVRGHPSAHLAAWASAASADVTGTTTSTARIAQPFGKRSVLNQGNRGRVPSNIQNPCPRTIHKPPRRVNDGLKAPIDSVTMVQTHRRCSRVGPYRKSRLSYHVPRSVIVGQI